MLKENLAAASQEIRRQRRRHFFIGAAAVGLGILALVSLSFIDFSIPLITGMTAPQVEEVSLEASSPGTRSITPPVTPSVPLAVTAAADSAVREQFKQRLRQFEEGAESRLASANLMVWNPQGRDDIAALKDQAMKAFASSDYGAALKSLNQAQELADNVLQQWQQNFRHALSQAQGFFGQDDYDNAKLEIAQARVFKPADSEAIALNQRIDSLPPIITLLEQIKVAQVENNLQQEIVLLRRVLELDPARVELLPELQKLQRQLTETRFSAYIERGLARVEARNLAGARSSLAKARKIHPARSEVKLLAARIDVVSKAQMLARGLDQSQSALVKDDWQSVLAVAEKTLKVHPENRTLLDRQNLASRIISTRGTIQGLITSHQRLASKNVKQQAQQILQQAKPLAKHSFSLQSKMDELEKLLQAYDRSVEVFIKSDNQTYILVRGVGQVGITAGRSIKLKPGKYIFEGRREGFRSTLVSVQIAINNPSVTVEVVCDEPI